MPRKSVARSGGKSGTRGQLLETCVQSLRVALFQVYDSKGEFDSAPLKTDHYVILNYPHLSLYGTPGRKEALIHAEGEEFILEAKWQDGSGSVDEKLPYVWMAFLASPIPNWIAVLDGRYWTRDTRALRGVAWLKAQEVPDGRQFHVFTRRQFTGWATDKWVSGPAGDGVQRRRAALKAARQAEATFEQLQWGS